MTVAQLIEELQKQAPHKTVMLIVERHDGVTHSVEADTVINEGAYVLIDSR